MTTPYVTGTVSVTAGSAVVTGDGTGWDTSGLIAGVLGVDGLSVPVLSIDSDTSLTLAKPWPGPTGSGKGYWITYDTDAGQQTIGLTQLVAEYVARLAKPFFAAFSGLTPAADKLPFFLSDNTGALADFPQQARSLLALEGAANKLPYQSGASTYATTDLTPKARELLALPDSASIRSALGIVDNTNLANPIFNGQFQTCQRGLSQTSSGYGSDDCWLNEHNGSSKTHTIVASNDPTIPGNPSRVSVTTWTSVVGAVNYVRKAYRIQNVRRFAGKRMSLMFLAKADASRNIAVEIVQNFGTGGSPSSTQTGADHGQRTLVPLTTLMTSKKTVVFDIPSIGGKIIGTNEDSYTEIVFWFDAGTNFNSRTNNLGQSSGSVTLANVHFQKGDEWASLPDSYQVMEQSQVDMLCKARFMRLQNLFFIGTRPVSGQPIYGSWVLPVTMIKTPATNATKLGGANSGAISIQGVGPNVFWASTTVTDGSLQSGFASMNFDIDLSADL
ncbi:hypothetical protein ASF69_04715 [Rhizobium sp. Leaf311]|nr:hypothetical protein ASF69_04715 [Rhizobium sp. Leaf311]